MPGGDIDRTLYLLRHAKSSWDDAALADHDRPLAPRGLRAGATIARHLREQGIAPDLVLCSSALRTRQTLELVAEGFGTDAAPEVVIESGLYEASAEDLLARVRRVPDGIGSVMLIGHQPAIQDLALALVSSASDRERLGGKFPTAALATLAVPGAWRDFATGSARLESMVKPRELERS